MTTVTALAAAGLLARLCLAAPPDLAAGPQGDVHIEGDVTYQPGTGRVLVEHGAVIRRGDVVVRAPTASYDPATGEVRATGGVVLTDATRVVFADALRAVLDGAWEAEGVVAFVKDRPADLSAVSTLDEARRAGRNRVTFSGESLHGDRTGRFQLDGARLTLCDCPDGAAPSWEITSRRADVVAGKRATMSWPVLRVTPRFLLVDRPIPILVLPWLYLPLGDRQTGFLIPEFRSTGATGFTFAQPLFVTLGRSWDLTITPMYAFGAFSAGPVKLAAGSPAVRGPGATLELRWAPAVGTAGRGEVAWFHDLEREPHGEGGDRFALTGVHEQRLSPRTGIHAALQLAGDPVWVRDFTEDNLAKQVPYRRSDLLVSRRGDALVLEAGLSYLQPMCPLGIWSPSDANPPPVLCQGYGTFGAGLGQASRWPTASATLVPVAAGPLRVSARAGAARFAPVEATFDATGSGDRPPRPATTRADAEAEVSLPLVLGRALSLSPWVRGAAAGYAFEADHLPGDPERTLSPAATAWAVGGAVLGTEVSRSFGKLRHAIAPRIEWRAGTAAQADALEWLAYDAIDRTGGGRLASGPPGAWQQLRAAIDTRLSRGAADVAHLEVGQDLDLRSGLFGETFASAGFSAGRLGVDASARFLALDDRPEPAAPPRIRSAFLDRFTELHAGAAVSDTRGDNLHAGFFSVGAGGSGTLGAGRDPLFDLRPVQPDAAAGATAGARFVAGPATIGYDAQLPGRAAFVASCSGSGERQVNAFQVQQHTATFTWDSPCHCFRFAARLRVNDCGAVAGNITLDLSRVAAGARAAP